MRHLAALFTLGACACAVTADVAAPDVQPSSVETALVHRCVADGLTWMAVQNDAGPWTRVVPDAQHYFSVRLAKRGGIALVYADDPRYRQIRVLYGTPPELRDQVSNCPETIPPSGKSVTGIVAGIGDGTHAVVGLGQARAFFLSSTEYSIQQLDAGARDLVAFRTRDYSTWPTRVIVRRALNVADSSRIPLLDFDGVEAAALSPTTLTITGIGSGRAFLSSAFSTATSDFFDLVDLVPASPTQVTYGVPAALTQPGDHHDVIVEMTSSTEARMTLTRFRDPVDRTIALGPALAVATTSTVATTPYVRPQTRMPSQAEYADGVSSTWFQDRGTGGWTEAGVEVSREYLGGRPDTWDTTMPDLTGAGFDPAWGLQSGLPIAVTTEGVGGRSIFRLTIANRPDEFDVRYAGRRAAGASSAMSILGCASGPPARTTRRPTRVLFRSPGAVHATAAFDDGSAGEDFYPRAPKYNVCRAR